MSQEKPRFSPRFEEFAVRVMYFMTTIDSYVPLAATTSFLGLSLLFGVFQWTWWLPVSLGVTLAAFYLADYYPTFAAVLPIWIVTLILSGGVAPGLAIALVALCLVLGALTQMVFQGTPHVVASRDRSVIWRMLASSTMSLAPTTLSLPVPCVTTPLTVGAAMPSA